MLSVSACKISVPAFSVVPDPLQEEEVFHAVQEIDRLSAEASVFPLREGRLRSASEPLDIFGTRRGSPTHQRPVSTILRKGNGSQRTTSERPCKTAELVDTSLNFSCFEDVRVTYLEKGGSPLRFQPGSCSFPYARRIPGVARDGGSPERTRDSFPQFSPPNATDLARMRFPVAYTIQGDKTPLGSSKWWTNPSYASPTRTKPAVRRKPVPKLEAIDLINSSFMRLSSMNSFPVFRPEGAENPQPELVTKGFRRSDTVREYSLRFFLSQGAQGKVYLATSGVPTKVSAIKVISKLAVESYRTLLQEQKLLRRIKGHQFVLNMVDSFHDTENFYLVTDFYPGGDLAHLLYKLGIFETDMARFYIAELIVAVRFLHGRQIVHRDLKPGNILIKSDGHICLVDFGLCKDFQAASTPDCFSSDQLSHESNPTFAWPTTRGFAGTLAYMSPQAVNQDPYSYETDWWSLGIISYEFLQGDTPWVGSDIPSMVKKIRREPLSFRKDIVIDEDARDFLENILQKRIESRLPSHHFERHKFFRHIEFSDVGKSLLTPPYVPSYQGETLATGELRELDKIYVGRPYDPSIDPFPEYDYNYRNEPHESLDLEYFTEYFRGQRHQTDSRCHVAPRQASRKAKAIQPKTKPAVEKTGEWRRSYLRLLAENSFNTQVLDDAEKACPDTKGKRRASRISLTASSLLRLSTAVCSAFLNPINSGIALKVSPPAPANDTPEVATSPITSPPATHQFRSVSLDLSASASSGCFLAVQHSNSSEVRKATFTKQLLLPHISSPCLSPPSPSMLTVSSVVQTNSLFSVNLPEGLSTQTTLHSILENTSAGSASSSRLEGTSGGRPHSRKTMKAAKASDLGAPSTGKVHRGVHETVRKGFQVLLYSAVQSAVGVLKRVRRGIGRYFNLRKDASA